MPRVSVLDTEFKGKRKDGHLMATEKKITMDRPTLDPQTLQDDFS